jgi:hypothetical protein
MLGNELRHSDKHLLIFHLDNEINLNMWEILHCIKHENAYSHYNKEGIIRNFSS